MNRLVIAEGTFQKAVAHLDISSGVENGLFATYLQYGDKKILQTVIEPTETDWLIREESHLQPSTSYLARALDTAIAESAGLLFVHTHPLPGHPAESSYADKLTFQKIAEVVNGQTQFPFAAAIISQSGWFAEEIQPGQADTPLVCQRVGTYIINLSTLEESTRPLDDRQLRALGPANSLLQVLKVGVVGSGGLGSSVAEQLTRMGVTIVLIDDDVLDEPSNLRRIYGAKLSDYIKDQPEPKVDVVGRYLTELELSPQVETINANVQTNEAHAALKSCDVVICCTDTDTSRVQLINFPYEFHIPVIDIGVRVAARTDHTLAGLIAAVRTFTPLSSCAVCNHTINFDKVRLENKSKDELDELKKQGYVPDEFGRLEPSLVALTTLAAALATNRLIALLTESFTPSNFKLDGLEPYLTTDRTVAPSGNCRYCGHLAKRVG